MSSNLNDYTGVFEESVVPNATATAAFSNNYHASVCDSMGQVHLNRCFFDVAKCRAKKIERISIEERNCTTRLRLNNVRSVSPASVSDRPEILPTLSKQNAEVEPILEQSKKNSTLVNSTNASNVTTGWLV